MMKCPYCMSDKITRIMTKVELVSLGAFPDGTCMSFVPLECEMCWFRGKVKENNK